MRIVDVEEILENINAIEQSPWYWNGYKEEGYHRDFLTRKDAVEMIRDVCIRSAKTVDPVKHGRWERYEDEFCSKCSNCGYVLWHDMNTVYNYCGNCGSKMRENVDREID